MVTEGLTAVFVAIVSAGFTWACTALVVGGCDGSEGRMWPEVSLVVSSTGVRRARGANGCLGASPSAVGGVSVANTVGPSMYFRHSTLVPTVLQSKADLFSPPASTPCSFKNSSAYKKNAIDFRMEKCR